MVTLLLTFFVLLLSLADVQDPELFNKGRDAFWQSIKSKGMGILFGYLGKAHLGEFKSLHTAEDGGEKQDGRTVDAELERVKRQFAKVSRQMKVVDSQIVSEQTDFLVTGIRFKPGGWNLTSADKRFLDEYCLALERGDSDNIYILGLCGDCPDERECWLVSARRAKAVADHIKANLSNVRRNRIESPGIDRYAKSTAYWWGAGTGGQWVEQQSPVYRDSQILIAVLRGSLQARGM
jgi:hypothetical protein